MQLPPTQFQVYRRLSMFKCCSFYVHVLKIGDFLESKNSSLQVEKVSFYSISLNLFVRFYENFDIITLHRFQMGHCSKNLLPSCGRHCFWKWKYYQKSSVLYHTMFWKSRLESLNSTKNSLKSLKNISQYWKSREKRRK